MPGTRGKQDNSALRETTVQRASCQAHAKEVTAQVARRGVTPQQGPGEWNHPGTPASIPPPHRHPGSLWTWFPPTQQGVEQDGATDPWATTQCSVEPDPWIQHMPLPSIPLSKGRPLLDTHLGEFCPYLLPLPLPQYPLLQMPAPRQTRPWDPGPGCRKGPVWEPGLSPQTVGTRLTVQGSAVPGSAGSSLTTFYTWEQLSTPLQGRATAHS